MPFTMEDWRVRLIEVNDFVSCEAFTGLNLINISVSTEYCQCIQDKETNDLHAENCIKIFNIIYVDAHML